MSFDETHAFMCAAKNEPYSFHEWQLRILHLTRELNDATERMERAREDGVCLPARFDATPAGQDEPCR